MYICENCGEIFDEPLYVEERPCSEFPETETWSYCPHCHNDEYEEAVKCKICDEWHSKLECEDDVCESCIEKTMSSFYSMIASVFDDEERKIISDNIDRSRI